MSTTIDQNVVEMRFDNSHFEQNVSKSMNTLNNFKQSLKFDGASQGMEQIGTASNAMFTKVSHGYAVLQSTIVEYATNIRRSIESTVKALTIDPVTTGFKEYETQINATQTILANTESKGSTIEDVNRALEELNKYADKTIYNFTEMTRNIGTFTAAGVELKTATNAIQGIANLAAVSGSTSQQASTAMYQLSQALSSGTVKLMDWNSVVNAGMGGQVFQDALKDTARVHGVAIDEMIEDQGSFRETLSSGWLTADILTETLEKFTMSTEGLTEAEIEANRVKLQNLGYTEEQIEAIFKLGNTATDAATKVKTWSQLWEVLKESAQSGWSQSWKIIVGDFEEAKALFTPLADTLTGFINKMSDARNRVLEIALAFTDPITSIMDKLNSGGIGKLKDTIKSIGDLTDKLEYYQDVVAKVWRGDYGNHGDNPDRFDLLTAEGYDWRIVQDLVNKGYEYTLTVDDIEASYKKFGVTVSGTSKGIDKFNTAQKHSAITIEDCGEAVKDANEAYRGITDEQLRAVGVTEEEIRLFRALEKESDRLGISIDDLSSRMSKNNGRSLLIETFTNFGDVITGIGKAAAEAWEDIFNPPSLEEIGVRMYTLIESLKKFSESIRLTDASTGDLNDTGKKIKRTFDGIFAVIDVVTTILGGGFKIAFEAVSKILGAFNWDILDLAANLGDALVSFRDWALETNPLVMMFDELIDQLPILVDNFKAWFNAFKETPVVKQFVKAVTAIGDAFTDVMSGDIDSKAFANTLGGNLGTALRKIPEIAVQIGKDFISGFVDGFEFNISDVFTAISDFGKAFADAFSQALGGNTAKARGGSSSSSSSSSKDHGYATGEAFSQGFVENTTTWFDAFVAAMKPILESIKQVFSSFWDFITDEAGNIEWGKLFAAGSILALVWTIKNVATAIGGIAEAIGNFGKIVDGIGDILHSFSGVLNGVAWDLKGQALLKMAAAIAVLVASIWVLTTIDNPTKILDAVLIIGVLAAILVGLAIAMDKLSSAGVSLDAKSKKLDINGIQTSLMQIGMALTLVAAAVMMIGMMDADEAKRGITGLAAIAIGLIVFIAVIAGISRYSGDVTGIGSIMTKVGIAVILLAAACKLIGMLSEDDMTNGLRFMTGFTVFMGILIAMSKSANNDVSKVGGFVIKLSVAMLLLVAVCKLVGLLSPDEISKGILFAVGFAMFIGVLVSMTKIGKQQHIAKIGGLVLGVSASLLLMVGVCKLVGMLTPEELVVGAVFVAAFALLIKAMVGILTIGNDQQIAKVTGVVLAMSVAIGVMALVATLLSFVPLEDLAKGVAAVTILGAIMALMISSLKGAQNAKGAILNMAIAIGVMAVAVAALSFIPMEDLLPAAAALTMVMLAFAAMIAGLRGVKNVKIAPLLVLTLVVAALAAVLFILQDIDPASAIANSLALSVLLVALTVVVSLLSLVSMSITNALLGALALTALVVPMLAFIGALALMSMVPNAMDSVIAITALMVAMTVVLTALSVIGMLAAGAIAGVVGLTAIVVPMLAFVGILALMSMINDAERNVGLLIVMMTALTVMLTAVAVIGPMATLGVSALWSLIGVITVFGLLVTAVGALMQEFPQLQDFLNTGIPIFEQLAHALGSVVANLITGFMDGIADGLPGIAENLSEFATKLVPFMAIMQLVPEDLLGKVGILSGAILALTAVDVLAGLASLITNGSSLAQLGTDLSNFAINALPFITVSKSIDPASMEGVKALAEVMTILTSNNIIEGLTSWFTGGTSLESFGKELSAFGPYMKEYAESVAGIDSAAVEASANAASSLATMATNLPDSGGFLADLMGDNTMSQFGNDLVTLGKALNDYSAAVVGLDLDSINNSVTAASSLSDLATNLPDSGGFLADIMGDNTMSQFGTDLTALGKGLADYSEAVKGLDTDAVDKSVTAAASLSDLAANLPDSGGFIAEFMGDNNIADFGADLKSFGEAMVGYSNSVTGIDADAMMTSVTAAEALSKLATSLDNTGGIVSWWEGDNDLATFGTSLKGFGTSMKNFSDEVAGINTNQVDAAVLSIARVVNFATGVAGINFDSLTALGDNLAKVATTGIDGFIEAFENAYDDLETEGGKIADKLIAGAKKKSDSVVKSFGDIISNAITGIRSKYSDMKTAGEYLGAGLITGMNNKWFDVYRAGYNLGLAAVLGEKAGQQSNSPSKLTYKAGKWLGEGLIGGMEAMSDKVYDSGHELGDGAAKSMTDTVARIANMISDDMDVQPTIRPIIDLSDVKTGVDAIGSMFGNTSMGITANTSAINSIISAASQNRGNDSVVAKLNELNKKLDNLGNTTYQINGVTYDDGSNIATAVQTITRAALRERRV